MPQHRVRLVGLAEELDLLGAELDLAGRHRLLDMTYLAGADDGRCQSRLMQQPGVTDPGIAFAALGGKLAEAVHHGEVFFPVVELAGKLAQEPAGQLLRCAG